MKGGRYGGFPMGCGGRVEDQGGRWEDLALKKVVPNQGCREYYSLRSECYHVESEYGYGVQW